MSRRIRGAAFGLLLGAVALGGCSLEDVCPDQPTPAPPATIGSDIVVGLDCAEDELIGYVQQGQPPYSLGCIHAEEFTGYK